MLQRCYDEKYHAREPSYKRCRVCVEWLTFSNFQSWFNDPNNGYNPNYHLDKDLIIRNNSTYSPQTCCFLPRELNALFHPAKKHANKFPTGVQPNGCKFRADINMYGRSKYLGVFQTVEAAFFAYKNAKEKYVKELAEKYFKEGKITERVYNALLKYEVVD